MMKGDFNPAGFMAFDGAMKRAHEQARKRRRRERLRHPLRSLVRCVRGL